MTPEELLRAGQLAECLQALQAQVRQNPADPKKRLFLFQLLAVMGQWERALNQLSVVSQMDPACQVLAQMYGPAIQAEALRADVFAGRRSALILGDPEPWVGLLTQANALAGQGQHAAAADLRAQALEQAPATAGTIDGRPFGWLADADPRLGPVLEIILNGAYYWVPVHRIKSVRFEPPTDLRDVAWMAAEFQWANGGQAVGLVPARYPGSEASADPAIRLGRRTEWAAPADGAAEVGLGQRLLATDEQDFALLDVRAIDFAPAEGDAARPNDAPADVPAGATAGAAGESHG